MSSVIISNASVAVAERTILHEVDLSIGPESRLALVGPNGVGKTMLLRLIAGKRAPDSGSVERRPANATAGFLPQERDRRRGETAGAYLRRRTGVAAAEADLDRTAGALAAGTTDAEAAYAAALERYLTLGGPDLEIRIPSTLREVGLGDAVLDIATTDLSGGQLARLALASILLARFDLLLLDEPTNDLDLDGVEHLEAHLAAARSGLVVVSHDRTFLERTTTEVAEIDEFSREVRVFRGGYAAYVEERDRSRQHAVAAYERYEERRGALLIQARTQREWARAGQARVRQSATAGRSGERDKFIRHARSQGAQSRTAAAARIDRALDRLDPVASPRTPWQLRLTLAAGSRGGEEVAALDGAVVRRGEFVLGPIDVDLRWGDRLALVGPNGSGKSTLLAALLGRLPLQEGRRRLGRSTVVGEIGQVRGGLPAGETLTAAFRAATDLSVADARTLLAKFGLGADDVGRPVRSLSPGERTRAELALLAARKANLLVLDEPTNHLDIEAIEQLEQALETYDGTLILVTHDRRLLDRVAPTHVITLAAGRPVAAT